MSNQLGFAAVTGAGRGIGRATALKLASDGHDILVIDRDAEAGAAVGKEITAIGRNALACAADVRSKTEILDSVLRAREKFGPKLQTFVNNAGYTQLADPLEVTAEQWDAIIEVNARGTLFGSQVAAEHLTDGGSIVNVSSATARGPYVPSPHYAASKAAVLSLTMTFAAYLAPRRIRVNCVAPAIIDTDLWDDFDLQIANRDNLQPGTAKAHRIAQIPIGRAGKPSDTANAISFLANSNNGFITGECIDLTGGSMMR